MLLLNISMKRLLHISIIIATSLLFTSCDLFYMFFDWSPVNPEPREQVDKGFIYDYFHIDEDIKIESEITENSLIINFSAYSGDRCAVNKYLDVAGENYADYMEKYGDQPGYKYDDIDYWDKACAESIRAIDIIPLTNWDEEHPRLVYLNDIFEVEYATYKYFVESGFNNEDFELKNRERTERKRVSELEENDMWFIHTDFRFICTTLPERYDSVKLRVKLYLDTKEEIEFDVEINQ